MRKIAGLIKLTDLLLAKAEFTPGNANTYNWTELNSAKLRISFSIYVGIFSPMTNVTIKSMCGSIYLKYRNSDLSDAKCSIRTNTLGVEECHDIELNLLTEDDFFNHMLMFSTGLITYSDYQVLLRIKDKIKNLNPKGK